MEMLLELAVVGHQTTSMEFQLERSVPLPRPHLLILSIFHVPRHHPSSTLYLSRIECGDYNGLPRKIATHVFSLCHACPDLFYVSILPWPEFYFPLDLIARRSRFFASARG